MARSFEMKISVIGAGYVGLVTAACFADKGHSVVCVDIDADKVTKINNGIAPVYERGLEELLRKNQKYIRATTDIYEAVVESEVSFITVGTPFDGKAIDLTHVIAASRAIGRALKSKGNYHAIAVKSTVVPGTTDEVVLPTLEEVSGKTAGVDFGVGVNPEFLREGDAIQDFLNPDRVVIGGIDPQTQDLLEKLYEGFGKVDILKTNNKTAEMIKYASNSLFANLISFSNEIANLCAAIGGIDILDVMDGVHLDKRLNPINSNGTRVAPSFLEYLRAGCGYGGSCFPKDLKALISCGKQFKQPMQLLQAVVDVNQTQPFRIISLIKKHFRELKETQIAILGLAFKSGTDDVRESPSLSIIRDLLAENVKIKAYDPVAARTARKLFDSTRLTFSNNVREAIADVDVIVVLTGWEEFKILPELLARLRQQPLVIDGRRILDKKTVARYAGIGL
jgi:UDPglucose 6-dehydrogenase